MNEVRSIIYYCRNFEGTWTVFAKKIDMETESCTDQTQTFSQVGNHSILWIFPSDEKVFIVVIQTSVHKLYECSDMLAGCTLKFQFTGLNGDAAVPFPGYSVVNPFRTQHGKISNPLHAMCARFGLSDTNYKLYCGVFDSKFNYIDANDWRSKFLFIDNMTVSESFVAMDWVLDTKFLVQYRNGTTSHTL